MAGCTTDVGNQTGRILANTGWTDEAREASLAVRQDKAAARRAARDRMFEEQRKRGGNDFVGNWYPRGQDGKYEDPHYGKSTPEAPYGYVEGTMTPRKEPLYDTEGRPIIPKSWEEYHKPEKAGIWPFEKDYTLDRAEWWLTKVEKAERIWGPFGRKKRFMDANAGASEADWKKYDREQSEKWKKGNGVDSRRSDEGG